MEDHVSGQVAKFSEVRCRAINLGTIPQHVTQKAEKKKLKDMWREGRMLAAEVLLITQI
jgi:hypothetical protein